MYIIEKFIFERILCVGPSVGPSVGQSVGQSVGWSIRLSIGPSVGNAFFKTAEFRLKGDLTSINALAQCLRLIMLYCVYEGLSVHWLVGPLVRQDGSLPMLKVDKENCVTLGVRMAV